MLPQWCLLPDLEGRDSTELLPRRGDNSFGPRAGPAGLVRGFEERATEGSV